MEGSDVVAASENRLRGKDTNSDGRLETRREGWARATLEILIVADAVAFLVASVVHFGLGIPLGFTTLADRAILPAAIAEGAIGIAFVLAAVAVFTRGVWAWGSALGAHLFGVLGVLIGLGVTLSDSGDSSPANLLFHEAILPVLIAGLALLLTRSGRAGLGRTRGERRP